MTDSTPHKTDFIRNIINADLEAGKYSDGLVFRFPPEPNGYLHVGHAKSICLNFGLARDYQATCHLRFDDTNPTKEELEYAESIKRDVTWLGGEWGGHLYHASDYFDQLYAAAVGLIESGDAYIESLSPEQMRDYRGTLKEPGKNSLDRDRSVEESLDLFARMRDGEFAEGTYCLRAKIDMASGNMNLRDPVLYRILHASHDRTGDRWHIYPMYDFAHSLSDAIEGITHSLCTLEFQDHRPLYDWCVEKCKMPKRPRQIEFSRLNLNYTVTSKRKLKALVEEGHVASWDDPRMPTISGLRRRGFTAAGIREFCSQVGVSKQDSVIDMSVLEECIRSDLNRIAPRRNAVLDPIKLTIRNYPEGEMEWLTVSNHPQDESFGKREVPFCGELYIERDDFMFDAPKKFFRLAPGREVRLLNAYAVRCDEVLTDEQGNVLELICTYDKDTLGGKKPADGRKIKGVVHWVCAKHAVDATVRIYDRLFSHESPGSLDNMVDALNPDSLQIKQAKCEPSLESVDKAEHFQFSRTGYFITDEQDHQPGKELVFNQVVTLKSNW
jgi:glutaminyl-tRNA synthetase